MKLIFCVLVHYVGIKLEMRLIFFVLYLLTFNSKFGTKAMPCAPSRQTVMIVSQCPLNEFEWNVRAASINCSAINQTCVQAEQFVYHCVLNENATALVEVCAPAKNIQGQLCAEFNSRGSILQESFINCSYGFFQCPKAYSSTKAYNYQSCYSIVKSRGENESTSPKLEDCDHTSTQQSLYNNITCRPESDEFWPKYGYYLVTFICGLLTALLSWFIYQWKKKLEQKCKGNNYRKSENKETSKGTLMIQRMESDSR